MATFEYFQEKFPELLEKSNLRYIGVGEGWHHLLDTLFSFYTSDVRQLKYRINYAKEYPEKNINVAELETLLEKALENLPEIIQIKEKFGGLRVYVAGGTEAMNNYTDFACSIASKTCEVCGNLGKADTQSGWIKTLCETHSKERAVNYANRMAKYDKPSAQSV